VSKETRFQSGEVTILRLKRPTLSRRGKTNFCCSGPVC